MRPKDAKPLYLSDNHGNLWIVFSAGETAQIAKAYASALHASEFNSAEAAKDAANWNKKFTEWENPTPEFSKEDEE